MPDDLSPEQAARLEELVEAAARLNAAHDAEAIELARARMIVDELDRNAGILSPTALTSHAGGPHISDDLIVHASHLYTQTYAHHLGQLTNTPISAETPTEQAHQQHRGPAEHDREWDADLDAVRRIRQHETATATNHPAATPVRPAQLRPYPHPAQPGFER
ncbi:hypothetical protein GGQ54_003336 [Naumannella cuiyingiana]|uniref:Uncharacterized protein n=1 Tax=Naumannella cuiyingiana TaxID=1347891 RepID=A0A7Z0DBX9_9ACTN|nr:hypothetical protein [Naumannella cuiyingiana]NYI72722.1 hypothetical protein [Naumannella cuiyingiana]